MDIPQRKAGLSLVEVCVAIGILVIMLSAVISSMSQGYRYLRKTRLQTVAQFLAQEAMELKFTWALAANDTLANVTGFPGFQREVIVTNPALTHAQLKKITVNVVWQEHGANKTFTLQSYKEQY
jgi:type II secretory pathway pseudopilin PulG